LTEGLFWIPAKSRQTLPSINLHLNAGRRAPEDLESPFARNIFHINWFVLERGLSPEDVDKDVIDGEKENLDKLYTGITQKPIWKHGTLYGSKD
jgi:hypothetical protein